MGVQLTFAMSTDSSASMRVQSMLLPYQGRFRNEWVEQGDHTYLIIQVPEGGLEDFIHDVRACHSTVWQVERGHLTDVSTVAATR